MESIENYILGRLERGESLDTIMNDIAAAANSANKTHSANDNRKNGTSSLMDQLNRMDEDDATLEDVADLAMAIFFQQYPDMKEKYTTEKINQDRDILVTVLENAFAMYSGAIKTDIDFFGFPLKEFLKSISK